MENIRKYIDIVLLETDVVGNLDLRINHLAVKQLDAPKSQNLLGVVSNPRGSLLFVIVRGEPRFQHMPDLSTAQKVFYKTIKLRGYMEVSPASYPELNRMFNINQGFEQIMNRDDTLERFPNAQIWTRT